MYRLEKGFENGFTDGNGRHAEPLDVVEYRFGCRRGILMESLQDGDAYVLFRDTRLIETVKWSHLAVVPEATGPGSRERHDVFQSDVAPVSVDTCGRRPVLGCSCSTCIDSVFERTRRRNSGEYIWPRPRGH